MTPKQNNDMKIYLIIESQQTIYELQYLIFFKLMSDDELQMLQRQLMDVQQQKTNPLSDRTVAQILIKLQQKGFKFFTTTDNNEYITPSQIDQQIIKLIQQRGRLSLSILPQLLNLNQDLIESRINGICNKSTHVRHNSWLISKDYIQNLLLYFKQKLQVSGLVQLDEESLRYQFDIKFMEKIVNDNLNEFDADIRDHKMITRQYMRMKKKKVLGFLLAITRPIQISTVGKLLFSRQQKRQTGGDIEVIVRELLEQNQLQGKYQNLYYIPQRFLSNQKNVITKFLQNNGYLQYTMLQKNYMVPRPQEWIKKNLNDQQYLVFQGICFRKAFLNEYQIQLASLLKGDGFADISSVIPFDLQEKKMNKFLTQHCELKSFILNEGICYSKQWIEKCVNQFRHHVIFQIFFSDQKGKKDSKGKKKAQKKQKKKQLTEQQLIQTLFDAGLAEYSIAENIAQSLLPVLFDKLEQLKVKLQKQLAQSQGVIRSNFLQYRKCKTIVRSPQNLTRTIKIIEKQKKKQGEWEDPDFGICQSDQIGQYSLIFYDKILPNQWPTLKMDNLRWKSLSYQQIFKSQSYKSKFMSKSLLIDALQILECFNKTSQTKLNTPILDSQSEQSPYYFRFFSAPNQQKYVLVDQKIPYFVEIQEVSQGNQIEKLIQFASSGLYGLVQKAYAKFRYCYRSLLSVSFHQLMTELTGLQKIQKLDLSQLNMKIPGSVQEVMKKLYDIGWSQNRLVIFMAEGKQEKIADVTKTNEDKTSPVLCLKPYMVVNKGGTLMLLPQQIQINIDQKLFTAFSNIWVIGL